MFEALILATALTGIEPPNYEHCIVRDARGRIARSAAQRRAFAMATPCPATGSVSLRCPGYVIDHVVPLKRCGADAPHNMQWQTIEEAREKDRWE
jgi:hypothetical protein